MRKSLALVLAAAFAGSSQAADIVDVAKVVSSTPITERVPDPKQECWMETVTSTGTVTQQVPAEDRSIGGALVGGLVGGIVGNQVGQGRGNTAATAAGAVAGALIGDRMANQNASAAQTVQVPQTQSRQERHCRTIDGWREVVRGYNVTYRYNGKTVTTRLPYDPGPTVKVGVSVLSDSNNPPPPPPGNPPPPPRY